MDHRMTHGARYTPEYTAWCNMRKRCADPKHESYPLYGGRGIRVAAAWAQADGFAAFAKHVGPRPSARHTLDRIDTNGNYEPGNVRWATRTEQTRSRRNATTLTFEGETRSLTEWAELKGITYKALEARLRVLKWDPAKALNTPLKANRRRS